MILFWSLVLDVIILVNFSGYFIAYEKKKRTNKWARNSRNYLCSKSERERVVRAREREANTHAHTQTNRGVLNERFFGSCLFFHFLIAQMQIFIPFTR